MTKLTATAIPVLTAAGWHPGRSIGPDGPRDQYAAAGFHPPPCVLTFMDEFGELTFDIPHRKAARQDPCTFQVRLAIKCFKTWIADWERVAEATLTPVGRAGSGPYHVFMAQDGRVFQACENIVEYIGVDGVDAVNGYLGRRAALWTRFDDAE